MWCFNKPSAWLKSLPPAEFEHVMEDARRQAPKIKSLFREREQKIAELRATRQREKREQLRAKEENKLRERALLIDKVEELGGLWKNEDQVKEGLAKVKGKGRLVEALKAQINFRRKVLQQQVLDQKDWTFSENSKPLNIDSLTTKLINIISQAL